MKELFHFIYVGSVAGVKKLISQTDINVNCPLDGRTPLIQAVSMGNLPIVNALLTAHGVDVNIKEDDLNALLVSLDCPSSNSLDHESYVEVAKALVAVPAIHVNAVDRRGVTPLMLAVDKCFMHFRIFNLPNRSDPFSPEHRRLSAVYLPVVEKLCAVPGIDVNLQDKIFGNTALITAAGNGSVDMLRAMLKAGVQNINLQNFDGNTALMAGAAAGCIETVHLLLSVQGIDVNVQNKDGESAMDLAHSYWRSQHGVVSNSGSSSVRHLYNNVVPPNAEPHHYVIAALQKAGARREEDQNKLECIICFANYKFGESNDLESFKTWLKEEAQNYFRLTESFKNTLVELVEENPTESYQMWLRPVALWFWKFHNSQHHKAALSDSDRWRFHG